MSISRFDQRDEEKHKNMTGWLLNVIIMLYELTYYPIWTSFLFLYMVGLLHSFEILIVYLILNLN